MDKAEQNAESKLVYDQGKSMNVYFLPKAVKPAINTLSK